jgi:cardiolipin synthase A/B
LRILLRTRELPADLRRLGFRVLLIFAAVQAALVGALVAMAEIRKRREEPKGSFPWVDQPEIELESGDDRIKIYPYGVELYETMLKGR